MTSLQSLRLPGAFLSREFLGFGILTARGRLEAAKLQIRDFVLTSLPRSISLNNLALGPFKCNSPCLSSYIDMPTFRRFLDLGYKPCAKQLVQIIHSHIMFLFEPSIVEKNEHLDQFRDLLKAGLSLTSLRPENLQKLIRDDYGKMFKFNVILDEVFVHLVDGLASERLPKSAPPEEVKSMKTEIAMKLLTTTDSEGRQVSSLVKALPIAVEALLTNPEKYYFDRDYRYSGRPLSFFLVKHWDLLKQVGYDTNQVADSGETLLEVLILFITLQSLEA